MNGNYTVAEVVDDGIGNAILVAFAPKIPAFLSVVGSYVMMREIAWILLHRNKHRGPKEERISHPILCTLFSICLADIFYSLPFIFTTWAAPSHIDDPLLWGNVGSTATCTAQGFVLHLGAVSSPMFNFLQAFLSVFFVKYSWSEARVAVLEQRFQIGLWTFALLTATVPLFLNMYNNGYVVCWLHSYPMGCKDSLTYGKDEANCERGDNAWLWGLIFAFFPRWPALLGGAVCMFIIYRAVRQMENRLARYAGASVAFATTNTCNSLEESTKNLPPPTQIHQTVSRERSHRVAIQAYLYILAYMGCQALNAINCYIWFAMHTYNEFFDVVTYAIAPSQGFWNFLTFAARVPKCTRGRESSCGKPGNPSGRTVVVILQGYVVVPAGTASFAFKNLPVTRMHLVLWRIVQIVTVIMLLRTLDHHPPPSPPLIYYRYPRRWTVMRRTSQSDYKGKKKAADPG
mmetsp:Transcript_14990/g.28398  ORF Transcript_14990/g.28398 Transcript_14990/m.28398 type:complete len:459 (-) Transcript_14990:42-1418(-)